MRPILRAFAYAASVFVTIVLFVGGFGYWAYSVRVGDTTGQVFGITVAGTFGLLLLCAVFVLIERRKDYPRRRRSRY